MPPPAARVDRGDRPIVAELAILVYSSLQVIEHQGLAVNPLRSAHASAVKKASIRPNGGPDFTVHDWRHHFACHAIMNGTDFETLRRMGGWKDLRMVQNYGAVSTEHMAEAIARTR